MTVSGFLRSEGVIVAPFLGGAIAYDVTTQTAHVVGPVAAWLLQSTGEVALGQIIEVASELDGRTRCAVEAEVSRGVEALCELGLLNRSAPVWWPTAVRGSSADGRGWHQGQSYAVLDQRIAFRSPSMAILDEVDAYLQFGVDAPPTAWFDLLSERGGRILLRAAEEWSFDSMTSLLGQLISVLNDFAVRSHSAAVLHSGAVRSPSGRVLLLAGSEGVGKSTLTAALLQAGCDYLSDEMVGVRAGQTTALPYPKPLELDPASRELVGLPPSDSSYAFPHDFPGTEFVSEESDAIDEILLPQYRANAPTQVARVEPVDAVKEVLAATLNVYRGGEFGLRAVAGLAERVPVTRIVHSDSVALAASLSAMSTADETLCL